MTNRAKRRMKRKFRRIPSGESKPRYVRKKPSKHKCAVCKGVLQGVPHGKNKSKIGKLAKSEKRPSVRFAGMLCNKCRTEVFEEAILVKYSAKKIDDVKLKLRKYVKQTEKILE